MPNRPARFTEADLRRAVKVAERAGPEWAVDILVDGTIRIVRPRDRPAPASPSNDDYDGVIL